MNAKSLKILFVVLVAAMAVSSCTSVNDCAMASHSQDKRACKKQCGYKRIQSVSHRMGGGQR